jgi:DNA-binding IclR family transcriptional regulator
MKKSATGEAPAGAQTLLRGLSVIDAVAGGARSLPAIGAAIGCTRSTTHRLVSALTGTGFLGFVPGVGYVLGSKLIQFGAMARGQRPLAAIARPHLEMLAERTQDTVHLGLADGDEVFYLDKISAKRGLETRSRIGNRMPLAFTGIGKALILDAGEERWLGLYEAGLQWHARAGTRPENRPSLGDFLASMRRYVGQACAFDLEENEVGVRCVAAPVRDASGGIVAAISVAGAVHFMPMERLADLRPAIIASANAISAELGWRPPGAGEAAR